MLYFPVFFIFIYIQEICIFPENDLLDIIKYRAHYFILIPSV